MCDRRTTSSLGSSGSPRRNGELLASGFPKPVAAAKLLLDFEGGAHATVPPLAVQQATARAILKFAQSRR
jgi:hypothetical protein